MVKIVVSDYDDHTPVGAILFDLYDMGSLTCLKTKTIKVAQENFMKQSGISFLVTNEEFNLLERIIYLEPGIDEVLDRARDEDGQVRLKMTYDDLGECLEALSMVI